MNDIETYDTDHLPVTFWLVFEYGYQNDGWRERSVEIEVFLDARGRLLDEEGLTVKMLTVEILDDIRGLPAARFADPYLKVRP